MIYSMMSVTLYEPHFDEKSNNIKFFISFWTDQSTEETRFMLLCQMFKKITVCLHLLRGMCEENIFFLANFLSILFIVFRQLRINEFPPKLINE